MIETEMQKAVADAAIAAGGQAMKMQNEFVRGVSDLLFKFPDSPAFFLEAKRQDLGPRTLALLHHTWKWDVSQLQKNFMRDWQNAGMKCGILSFVQGTGLGIKSLRVAIYRYEDCLEHQWTGSLADHVPLGDHTQRNSTIVGLLKAFAQV